MVAGFVSVGKKNFLPPAALEMGFGIMFRLDDESVGRHINDRRERDWGSGSVDATGRQMEKLLERYDICLPEKAMDFASAVVQPGFVTKIKSNAHGGAGKNSVGKLDTSAKAREPIPHNGNPNGPSVEKKGNNETSRKSKPSINKKKGRRYLEQDEEDRQIAMSILGHKSVTSTSEKASPEQLVISKPVVEDIRDPKDRISLLDANVQSMLLAAVEEGLLSLSELADEEVRGLSSFTVDQSRAVIELFLHTLRDPQKGGSPCDEAASNRWRPGSSKSAALAVTMRKYSSDLLEVLRSPPTVDTSEKFPSDDVMGNSDDEELMQLLLSEGMMDEAEGRLANEVDKLTGCPVEDDNLLFAIPVCAPYTSMQTFKYKIKLLPGQGKKGKVTRQALQLLVQNQPSKGPGKPPAGQKKDAGGDKERSHILAIPEPEALAVMMGDVKLSMPGLQQQLKASKESGKAKSKNAENTSKPSSSKKNGKKKKHG